MVLGYRDADIEAAVDAQRQRGNGLNGPTERLVELAELLVDVVPHADWAMFQKNGADATTTCVVIARAATGRRRVLVARGAYHGAVPWCNPYPLGATAEDRLHVVPYDYNDAQSLAAAAESARGDIAAVIVSAFKHDFGKDHELPTPAFANAARALCDATGAALIVDDVRAGFRLHIGGSWELVGVRPDLAAWSKAIANGYALAAVTGNERFREGASKVFVTGSFWTEAVPMAAAIATIGKLKAGDGIGRMQKVQQDLAQVNIKVALTPLEFSVWRTHVRGDGIPLTAVFYAPDYFGSAQYIQYFAMTEGTPWWKRAGGANDASITNAKESELLKQALAAPEAEKSKFFHDIAMEMINDRVIIPLVSPNVVLAHAKSVKGVRYSACCNLPLDEISRE